VNVRPANSSASPVARSMSDAPNSSGRFMVDEGRDLPGLHAAPDGFDDRVPGGDEEGMLNLTDLSHAARRSYDHRGTAYARVFVGAQRTFNPTAALAEPVREYDGIFERLTSTLSEIWRHGMCCVAEQRDAAAAPPPDRFPIVHVVAQDRVVRRGIDQGFDGIVPAAEPPQKFGFLTVGRFLA